MPPWSVVAEGRQEFQLTETVAWAHKTCWVFGIMTRYYTARSLPPPGYIANPSSTSSALHISKSALLIAGPHITTEFVYSTFLHDM